MNLFYLLYLPSLFHFYLLIYLPSLYLYLPLFSPIYPYLLSPSFYLRHLTNLFPFYYFVCLPSHLYLPSYFPTHPFPYLYLSSYFLPLTNQSSSCTYRHLHLPILTLAPIFPVHPFAYLLSLLSSLFLLFFRCIPFRPLFISPRLPLLRIPSPPFFLPSFVSSL